MTAFVLMPLVLAVVAAAVYIGTPVISRHRQARVETDVSRILIGLVPDPGEIRKHRRLPREWNERDSRPPPQDGTATTATYVPTHASNGVAGWDVFTYPGRHAYGRVHLIVGIEARAAYDATVLTVQAIIRSVHSKRELVTS